MLQSQSFEVWGFGAVTFHRDQILRDTGDELLGVFADLVLLRGSGELQRDFVAFPTKLERREARENAVQLLGGALGQNHHELVCVETNGQVGATDNGTHAGRKFTQGLIAGFATEAFVDQAEIFEIEHDEGERMTHALRACDFSGEALLGEAAIVEAGERIEHRKIAQIVELRLFNGKLTAQLLDQEFLANRVDVENNDERNQSKDGFGKANLEKGLGALMGCHGGQGDDRADEEQTDRNRIAAQRRVALLDQRQFVLEFAFARIERGRDEVCSCSVHVESRALAHYVKLEVRK